MSRKLILVAGSMLAFALACGGSSDEATTKKKPTITGKKGNNPINPGQGQKGKKLKKRK